MTVEALSFSNVRDEMVKFYNAGHFARALELVEAQSVNFPGREPSFTLWRVCLLSMCGRTTEALRALEDGLDRGFWWHKSYFLDPDLDSLRGLTEFQQLAERSHEQYLQARDTVQPYRRVLVPDNVPGPFPLLIALHGRSANADDYLEKWEEARRRGWLVLSPQSTQPLSQDDFFWDDPQRGMEDIAYHYAEIAQDYTLDPQRLVLAGFSQGSGMALLAALSGKFPVQGLIGIGTWWERPEEIAAAAADKGLRAYFVTGEKDHTLECSRAIQAALRGHGIAVAEETHSEIGHEFSADFGRSFESAIAFIFQEAE